jgi:multicomponent Na+:H+ antiporter subunit E
MPENKLSSPDKRTSMPHIISLFLALAAFWLINSGHYTLLILSLGLISIALVLYIAHRMDVADHESQPLPIPLKIPGFHLWLAKQIVLANISVVKHIWLGNKTISPVLTKIKANQKTDMGKVIYANSITLTPGTVAVDLAGDQITVHALLRGNIEDLQAGEMDRRICRLED